MSRERWGGCPECPFVREQLEVISVTQVCFPGPPVGRVPSPGNGLLEVPVWKRVESLSSVRGGAVFGASLVRLTEQPPTVTKS